MATSPHLLTVTWLLTYWLHSTVILAGVWLVTRGGPLSRPRQRAFLWKAGVLAGLFTASLQLSQAPRSESQAPPAPRDSVAPDPDHLTWTAHLDSGASSLISIRGPARASRGSNGCGQALGESLLEARLRLADPMRPLLAPSSAELEALIDRCGGGGGVGHWPWLLLTLWTSGALLGGGLLLCRRSRLNRALGASRTPGGHAAVLLGRICERAGLLSTRLLEASWLGTPIVLGGRRIVLPSYAIHHLASDELAAVLAHEVGHLVQRDPEWLQVLRVVEVILWIQPLNRLARRSFQEASDFLADSWAVCHTGSRLPLARSLEKVSRWSTRAGRLSGVLTMAHPDSPLVERVRAILVPADGGSAHGPSRWTALLLMPALLLPPVRVSEPQDVQVLVVGRVQRTVVGDGGADAATVAADRMEMRVYRLSGSAEHRP